MKMNDYGSDISIRKTELANKNSKKNFFSENDLNRSLIKL